MKPEVSVIMPVYNVEPYLRNSIESVLNQTYTNFELILIDDGSPDGCPQICDEYAKKDNRVKVIHKENGGVSSARNAGLEMACGQYVFFIDSDDTVEKDLISDLTNLMIINDFDIIIFGMTSFNIENNQILSTVKTQNNILELVSNQQIRDNLVLLLQRYLWNFSVDKIYKRKIITENNIKFNSYLDIAGEDAQFLLDLLPHISSLYVTDKYYYNYFIRNNQSMVKKFKVNLYEKYYYRLTRALEIIPKDNNGFQFLYKMYFEYMLWCYEQLFHKDCRYNLIQRYSYIRNTFSIDKMNRDFREKTIVFLDLNDEIKQNCSKSSRQIVKLLIKRRYVKAWLFHIGVRIKNGVKIVAQN